MAPSELGHKSDTGNIDFFSDFDGSLRVDVQRRGTIDGFAGLSGGQDW